MKNLEAFGRLIKQERKKQKHTQPSLVARTVELGQPVTLDLLKRIENAEPGRGNDENRDAICRALGGTLGGFQAAAVHDENLQKQLKLGLDRAQRNGQNISAAAQSLFSNTNDSVFDSDAISLELMNDMRSPETRTSQCRAFVRELAPPGNESQCQEIRELIGLLASCAFRAIPQIDGGLPISGSGVPKGWGHYAAVDANKQRAAHFDLEEATDSKVHPALTIPARAVPLTVSPDLNTDYEVAAAIIESFDEQLDHILGVVIPKNKEDEQGEQTLEILGKRLGVQIRSKNSTPDHLLLYGEDPSASHYLSLIKDKYLPELRVFDDIAEPDGLMLYCEAYDLGDFVRTSFKAVHEREKTLRAIAEQATFAAGLSTSEGTQFNERVNTVIIQETGNSIINKKG